MITYSCTGSEALEDATLSVGLDELVDGVLPLGDLDLTSESGASEVKTAGPGDTIENELVVKRSRDELLLAVLALPDDEEVASTGLCALTLGTVKPQDLVEASPAGILSGHEGGTVVGTDLCVAETTDPGADHVLGGSVEAHATDGGVHARHEGDDDIEHGFLGCLDAESGLRADHGGTEVEEATGAVLGQPAWTVDAEKSNHELLELLGLKDGEGDASGGHAHTSGVLARTEDTKLAIVATEDFETLEALCGVVKNGSGGHEAQRTVGLELGSGPASGLGPVGGDHVVGADCLEAGVGGGFIGDVAWGLGEGVGEVGGVEGGDGGGAIGGCGSDFLALDGGGGQVDVLPFDC